MGGGQAGLVVEQWVVGATMGGRRQTWAERLGDVAPAVRAVDRVGQVDVGGA